MNVAATMHVEHLEGTDLQKSRSYSPASLISASVSAEKRLIEITGSTPNLRMF